MPATLMPAPRQRFVDNVGLPLANGMVFTFAAGTSDKLAAFQDPDGLVPHENPIRLDIRGEATIYWLGNYKVDVRNALGIQLAGYPIDNFNAVDPNSIAAGGIAAVVASYAASAGSSLIGFIQAGVGAIKRTLQDKSREIVSPEDFGAKGDGVTDDAAAIQRAINSFNQGASCAIRLRPDRTYLLNSGVSTNNRSVVIDGNNAIVLVGANMDYGIRVVGTNCELRNFQVNRAAGITVTAGIYVTGLQHVINNITSRAQNWALFMLCQDMKESHIKHLRVDNDVQNTTGTIVQFDYCVNNTISQCMVGFCERAFYGSGAGQPTSGYHNEGILFSQVITVYADKAVTFDNGTFCTVANCLFDFCELYGVFFSNGTDNSVSNTWIASNLTNGFLGVGCGPNAAGTSVSFCNFVRGAAAITGTNALSLPCSDARVIGNRMAQGMNGGVVTHPTSQVIGNAVSGTAIFSDESAVSVRGSLAVSKVVQIDGSLTVAGSSGIFPSALSGSATAGAVGTSAPPATVAAFGVVNVGGTSYKLPLYNP